MPTYTAIYVFLLITTSFLGVVYNPLISIFAYLSTYFINPQTEWWGASVPVFLQRYSLIISISVVLGYLINKSKINNCYAIDLQEILLICFVAIIWLSIPLGIGSEGSQSNAVKMTKIAIILFFASHLITTSYRVDLLFYFLVVSGLYMGIEAYNAPSWAYVSGRLHKTVGGSDFTNGNILAGYFVFLIPVIGAMFAKNQWKTKILCIISLVFVINSIILVRSRASFLALIICVLSALVFAHRRHRVRIIAGSLVLIVLCFSLVNDKFIERMKLIDTNVEEMDHSAKSRWLAWGGAVRMALDYPLGIGEGNYHKIIGNYNAYVSNLDTHNTYLRCLAELGFHGCALLCFLIINAFLILRKIPKLAVETKHEEKYYWYTFAIKTGLVGYLVSLVFYTATYVEQFYWLLMMPVFLKRALINELNDNKQ